MKRTFYDKTDLGKSFGLTVAFMLVGQIVLSLIFSGFTDEAGNLLDWAFWLMQALYSLTIGSSAVVYSVITKTNFLSATTANKAPKPAHIGWGCLATLCLMSFMLPVNEWLLDLIEKTGLSRPSVDLPMQVVPMVLVAGFLPACTEELVFRGTVAQSLAQNKNKLATLAICGALFSVFHMNPAQTLHQFVLGGFLALLMFRSGSVWTASAVHLFNNLVAVVLSFLLTDESIFTQHGWIFVVVGAVGFAASVFGYIKTTKSCWKQGEEQSPTTEWLSAVALGVSVAVCVALWIANLVVTQ